MKNNTANSTKLFLIAGCLITGLLLFYLDYRNQQNVTNYQVEDANITIIDLSKETSGPSALFIFGIVFISIGIILILFSYFAKSETEKEEQVLNFNLTEQEKKIAALIKQKLTNKEIAIELSVSPSTVKTHINNIYKKVDINSRSELIQVPDSQLL